MIPIPGSAKLIGGAVAMVAVGMVVFAGYKYVTGLQQANAQLEADKAKLSVAVELKTAENESLTDGIKAMAAENAKLHGDLEKARATRRKLKRVFDDHDFTKLLNEKPGLIERRMVSGTDRMFRALEQASRD